MPKPKPKFRQKMDQNRNLNFGWTEIIFYISDGMFWGRLFHMMQICEVIDIQLFSNLLTCRKKIWITIFSLQEYWNISKKNLINENWKRIEIKLGLEPKFLSEPKCCKLPKPKFRFRFKLKFRPKPKPKLSDH